MNARKKKIGLYFIIAGILIPLTGVPLSSAYDGQDKLLWRLVRIIWTGEIILRDAKLEVVPDQDEELHKAFNEYRMENRDWESLPDDQIVDMFYNERYKGIMPRVEFNLKLQKKRVVTLQRKIALPNLYIFLAGLLMVVTGIGILIFAKREKM